MRLVNETQSEAELVRLVRDPESMAAALVVKSTYRIERGHCVLSRRQQPVLRNPTVIAGANFEPERVLRKAGVDLLVVGAAQASCAGTRMMAVGASVGSWVRQLLVFGDRVWQHQRWRWTASDPAVFGEMPVDWAHAFGGIARCDGNPLPHTGNPHGKGYVVDLDAAVEGAPLPNVEDPDNLLERPGQVVGPVGFGPLPNTSAIRVEAALDESKLLGVNRSIYNVAHPHHRLAELRGGERLKLWGWAGAEKTCFALPAETFMVELSINGRVHELWPQVDTVCVFPASQELVVIHRATFTYRYVRNSARVARLRRIETALPTVAGGAYV